MAGKVRKTKTEAETEAGFTYTFEDFCNKVDEYHKIVEEKQFQFPDEAGLLNHLDIEDEEYERMKITQPYARKILWARRRRESWLNRRLVSDKSAAAGCKIALAQEQNGGYSDKPETDRTHKFVVRLEGLSDTEEQNDE